MKWTEERRARHAALMRELWQKGRFAYRRPPRFERDPVCAICARRDGLRHFYLSIDRQKEDGKWGQRGAGAIDLCQRCWSDATSAARFRGPTRRAA